MSNSPRTTQQGTPCSPLWDDAWVAYIEQEETRLHRRICGARLEDGALLFALGKQFSARNGQGPMFLDAGRMLAVKVLKGILGGEGYVPVGSLPMHTMTWRELDFERVSDEP